MLYHDVKQQSWSRQEISILKGEYQKGTSYRRLSELLSRDISSIHNKVFSEGFKRKYESLTDGRKVGHLDIESSQLNASFGFILSWSIKVDGTNEIISDQLTAKDFGQKDKLQTDKRIVLSLVKAMEQFDVITHYFGDYFDVPFIRSRCLKHGVDFPEYGSIHTIDVWKIVKRNMKLHSHRLEAVAGHLGVNSKTKLDPNTWCRAVMGDMKAIDEVVEHNKQDVIVLEKVYHRLKRYWAGSRRAI